MHNNKNVFSKNCFCDFECVAKLGQAFDNFSNVATVVYAAVMAAVELQLQVFEHVGH